MALPIIGSAHTEATGSDFIWFIYGSSLSRPAFAAWALRHHYPLPDFAKAVPALLRNYQLSFDVESGFWGGAVASLREAPGQVVEGIALPMLASARVLVDHKEGALSGLFEPVEVEVTPLAGGQALHALAYRTHPARRLTVDALPAPSYVSALREGAKEWGLSAAYQDALAQLG